MPPRVAGWGLVACLGGLTGCFDFEQFRVPLGLLDASVDRVTGLDRGPRLDAGTDAGPGPDATAADLVSDRGAKRIGSAQLWHGPALLQHGSLLLDPPAALWQRLFQADPPELPPLPWSAAQLEQQLRRAAEEHLCGGELLSQTLSPQEWAAVRALEPLSRV